MIEFIDSTRRFINGVDLQLPNNTIAGPIFNDLFVAGMSFKKFELKYRAQSLRIEVLPQNEFLAINKYILKKDIWGSWLELIIATGHTDMDAIATVVCRDSQEFQSMNYYCQSNPRWKLAEHSIGIMHYVYNINRTSIYDVRRIQLDVGKQNDNVSSVGVCLTF